MKRRFTPFWLTFALLGATLPLLGGSPVAGVPLWVWGSLGATLLYALLLGLTIETGWDLLKEQEDE